MDFSLDVRIEIPRGSFKKRGTFGEIDFVSPIPCPFNYGSVSSHLGLDGDLLDAVVLGPTLEIESEIHVPVHGAVGLVDRGIYDDKLICSFEPISDIQRRLVVAFFHVYAQAKATLNLCRGQRGDHYSTGWAPALPALRRARPVPDDWSGPSVLF